MTDRFDHRCDEEECPHVGQRTYRACRCHKTREQMMLEHIAHLEADFSGDQVSAAMDAFYPGENWKVDLGCALDDNLRDMRAALEAARSA